MTDSFDPQAFKTRLQKQLKTSREAFDGKYKDELSQLEGLSRSEIDAIAPGTSDLQTYDALIAVVKEASRVNLAQTELITEIKKLGSVAESIAKKIPTFAALI